jgi:hypothetical protein
MWKKIVLGTLFVGLIGILVAGGIIRTVDRTAKVAEASELGRGRGQGNAVVESDCDGEGGVHDSASQAGSGQSGQGRGGGAQGASSAERKYPNYETAPEDWVTYDGTVVQAPAGGEELVIETATGEEITVGAGPGYMEMQGFALQAGEQVQVQGYWEDNELKAAQVTRLRDGETITLRDQLGRPAWAGGGRNVQGPYAGEGNVDARGEGTGTGQAEVGDWVAIQGGVVSVDASMLVVEATNGEEIVVEGRAWRFAQELGFWPGAGDEVVLLGFYENEDLEVGKIDDLTDGQTVLIREEGGRPLWAGRGRQGG